MKETTRIGADVGFGDTKVAYFDENGKLVTLVMASVYGLAAQVRNMDLGLGGPKRHRPFKFSYDGRDLLMGSDALLHSPLGITQSQTFERIGSEEERTLLLALLAKAKLTDVCIVTGLPVMAWERRSQLKKSWIGQHPVRIGRREMVINIREVRTAWQPVMSLWDVALTIKDGKPFLSNGMTEEILRKGWFVVDVGHNTLDIAGVTNLTPIEQWSGGDFLGGKDLLGVLQQHIVQRYGVSRSLSELQQSLRDGTIDIYDETVDLLPLARKAGADLAAQVVSEVSGKVKDASRFYGIILTGGPAKVVQPAMMRAFPRNQVWTLDQLGNARGAAKWALGKGVFKCLMSN